MRVVTAPNEATEEELNAPTLFLSGGITGAPNWQPEFIEMLKDTSLTVFNPRRPEFDVRDPDNTIEQIEWEARYLAEAFAVSFWFPKEAACQITLYELGRWTPTQVVGRDEKSGQNIIQKKKMFIGVEEGYRRTEDVVLQTKLARPEIEIVTSMEALAMSVVSWASRTGV